MLSIFQHCAVKPVLVFTCKDVFEHQACNNPLACTDQKRCRRLFQQTIAELQQVFGDDFFLVNTSRERARNPRLEDAKTNLQIIKQCVHRGQQAQLNKLRSRDPQLRWFTSNLLRVLILGVVVCGVTALHSQLKFSSARAELFVIDHDLCWFENEIVSTLRLKMICVKLSLCVKGLFTSWSLRSSNSIDRESG